MYCYFTLFNEPVPARLRAQLSVVLTSMATLTAVSIDGDWRPLFERHLLPSAA